MAQLGFSKVTTVYRLLVSLLRLVSAFGLGFSSLSTSRSRFSIPSFSITISLLSTHFSSCETISLSLIFVIGLYLSSSLSDIHTACDLTRTRLDFRPLHFPALTVEDPPLNIITHKRHCSFPFPPGLTHNRQYPTPNTELPIFTSRHTLGGDTTCIRKFNRMNSVLRERRCFRPPPIRISENRADGFISNSHRPKPLLQWSKLQPTTGLHSSESKSKSNGDVKEVALNVASPPPSFQCGGGVGPLFLRISVVLDGLLHSPLTLCG